MLSHVLGILQQETTLQIGTRRDSVARKKAGGIRREDSTQENMMMNAAGEELLHRRVYTEKLLRTEALQAERLLHREVFTQSGS